MSELANKIRELRGGYSQQEFAKHVGLSLRTITKIEAGDKPKRSNILRIAEKLRLPKMERGALLILWLKSELGDEDFEFFNISPRVAAAVEGGQLLVTRITKAVAKLSSHQQEHLLKACTRPPMLKSLAALNDLYEQILADAAAETKSHRRRSPVGKTGNDPQTAT